MHQYRWGMDDLYFACLLRPLNSDIVINPSEIADAKWMDVSGWSASNPNILLLQEEYFMHSCYASSLSQVDAYLADPETFSTNKMMAQAYKDGLARGLFVQPTFYPHFFKDRPDQVMYRVQPYADLHKVPSSEDGVGEKEKPKANI